MRTDIMVDIETLGTGEGSTVFQIVAMSFDITTGVVKDEIQLIGDIGKYDSLTVDGDTLKWWLNTNKELLTDLLNKGTLDEFDMYKQLHEWITKQSVTGNMKDVYLWGNGILFDNAKLQNELNTCAGLSYPIFFRNDRDMRTIVELACMKLDVTESEFKDKFADENEVKHDAYDDVKFQIRVVNGAYKTLMGIE